MDTVGGQGDKAARARTCMAVLFPLQRVFVFGRHSCPSGRGGNRGGHKRVCHAHIHNHRPPREVQEEVTALGVALGARRELCRTGAAAGLEGVRSSGGCGGMRCGAWGCMAGVPVVNTVLGAAAAMATAAANAAEASPGAAAAQCPAAAALPGVGGAAVADGTGGGGAWVSWREEGTAEAGDGVGMPGSAGLALAAMCQPEEGAGWRRVGTAGSPNVRGLCGSFFTCGSRVAAISPRAAKRDLMECRGMNATSSGTQSVMYAADTSSWFTRTLRAGSPCETADSSRPPVTVLAHVSVLTFE